MGRKRSTEFDPTERELEEFLQKTRYHDHVKKAIRRVFLDNETYEAAGSEFGLGRQRVYWVVRNVLRRLQEDRESSTV